MRNILLLAALLGGCTGGSSPNDTSTDANEKIGYLDAEVFVMGSPEPCQANIFESGDLVTTDYTGDGTLAELRPGTYEVMAGVSLDTLFSNSDELAKIEDMVDGWNLHPDEKGDLWIAPIQSVTVEVDQTKAVSIEMNLVPLFSDWTCDSDGAGSSYTDSFKIKDGNILDDLSGLPEMLMSGDQLFHESNNGNYIVEAAFVDSSLIHAFSVFDGFEEEIWCWAGDEGDDPR